eukprot:CAMPEP_0115248406 /NCGR_PEP_ID=MMETSP0270-20121206/42054_1 /TAXON_ID=71861 /ORGANISM="Scrippsiella trochoidea, Strain CCMP3099" /LENGTH=337 /DNA_ID=CAMNT_0002663707 /DNA_START=53 /DNA_END=1067 /DNA_ORIENTATION=+
MTVHSASPRSSVASSTATAASADASLAAPSNGEESRLDETAFRHFAPLLKASQAYASYSGCRFRSSSFDGLTVNASGAPMAVPQTRARDAGPRLAAKLQATPAVREFTSRLRAREAGLVEEVDRAFRIVMVESVRNAMQGMFQTLDMFPPMPPPPGIDDDDCAYEDVTAPLPVVAQRLYNDQARRVSDACSRLHRRAMTAAFIVDFAEGIGFPLPQIPETQSSMLRELSTRVAEETHRHGASPEVQSRARDAFLGNLGVGAAGEHLRQEARKWWAENWRSVLWGAAGAAVVGAAAIAVSVLAKRNEAQQERHDGNGIDVAMAADVQSPTEYPPGCST